MKYRYDTVHNSDMRLYLSIERYLETRFQEGWKLVSATPEFHKNNTSDIGVRAWHLVFEQGNINFTKSLIKPSIEH